MRCCKSAVEHIQYTIYFCKYRGSQVGSRVLFKNITTDTVLAYCIKQSSVPEGKRYLAAQRGNYLVLHFADQSGKRKSGNKIGQIILANYLFLSVYLSSSICYSLSKKPRCGAETIPVLYRGTFRALPSRHNGASFSKGSTSSTYDLSHNLYRFSSCSMNVFLNV